MSLWRLPLLHFLLLGGLLYAGRALLPAPAEPIALAETEIERLRADWMRDSGRAPTDRELSASVAQQLDEELLLREALRLGLDQRDGVIRRRLLMNMRFAFPESSLDDAALLNAARRLQMNTRDLVVRRRLVQLMQHRLVGDVKLSDAELREHIARHPQSYARPARRAFRQIYFSSERPAAQAQAWLQRLQAEPDAVTAEAGDAFLLGADFGLRNAGEIAAGLGPEFAAALMQAPLQQWSGPIRSPYGLHLVYVAQSESEVPADFAAVRRQAAWALRHEREQQTLQAALAELRQHYRLRMPANLQGSSS